MKALVYIRTVTAINISDKNTALTVTIVGAVEGGSMRLGVMPGGGCSAGISDRGTPGGIDMLTST